MCRYCSEAHFTTACPHQHTENYRKKITEADSVSAAAAPPRPGKYVPPGVRDQQKYASGYDREEAIAIRISNLSEDTTEQDLEELLKPFGRKEKMFLPKDKKTQECKGYAFVHFVLRQDAMRAIESINGHGYDHLILKAEWSHPPPPKN